MKLRAAIAAMLGAFVASAAAAEPSRVVIARERGGDAGLERAELRLAAELRAAGFVVEERAVEAADDARRAIEADGDPGARPFATVLLRRAAGATATDIWVADHVTKKTVIRRIDGARGEAGENLLAMRVVELMRASLVEPLVVPAPPGEPPAASPPPPDVATFAAPVLEASSRARFELGAGLSAIYGGPELGVAWGPSIHASFAPCEVCRARVLVVGPAFGSTVDAREGAATVRQELALAELALELAPGSRVRPFLAAGAGAYHLHASGRARQPFTDAHDDAWTALASAGAGAALRIARGASLTLGARALFALPRPVIDFAGDHVAALARPSMMFTLSLDADL